MTAAGQAPSGAPEVPATHGELAVKAQPVNAEVFIDERSVGNAPYEGVLEAGLHRVRVQAASFQVWESEVDVVIGEKQALNVVLSRTASAKVEVSQRRAKRSSSKSSATRTDTPSESETPEPTTPTKLDRGDSGFKKLGREDDSGFKKLGSDDSGIKKLK